MVFNKNSELFKEPSLTKTYYNDAYAMLTFVESVPCVKLRLNGVAQSSDHFRSVHDKLVSFVHLELEQYCRLHLLSDWSRAGFVLNEDLLYYKDHIIPQLEKAGIRYQAVVMPESALVRVVAREMTSSSNKKITIEYFSTVSGASKWLRNR